MAIKVSIEIPLRTVSEANARGSWHSKGRRTAENRAFTASFVRSAMRRRIKTLPYAPAFPTAVKLTRLAKGRNRLDDDNLRAALKAVRDGVADGLGCDDSARSGITWDYAEEIKQPDWGVRIEITWGTNQPERNEHADPNPAG